MIEPFAGGRGREDWAVAFSLQLRVVAALIRREMRAHFGESRLGYLWAVLQPLLHLAVLCFVFIYLLQRRAPVGGSLIVFFLSGLIPYFLYLHIAQYLCGAIEANRALLNLPPIKPIDVIWARAILESSTFIVVALILFGGITLYGDNEAIPWDLLTVIEATSVICLLGLGVGMINAVLSLFIRKWGMLFSLFFGPLYFFSGIFYSIAEVPPQYRQYLLYNPLLHCVIWFRAGFYHGFDENYLDRGYVLYIASSAIVIGFGLLRVFRRKILEPT
jgi:capsular polysaccharide transport system permease protein